jgi:hypothetical protein
MNSVNFQTALIPNGVGLAGGAALYQTLESGYDPKAWINGVSGSPVGCTTACTTPAVPGVIKSSWYGKPFLFQNARSIRFSLHYTF